MFSLLVTGDTMSHGAWIVITTLMTAVLGRPLLGQSTESSATADSSFQALQARGKMVMGVDQYVSRHRFDDLPDGGRIELQVDSSDTAGVRTIREHLRGIAKAFAAGNFRTPGLVHEGEVPGTAVLAARRDEIVYRFGALPGGGEVRILTASAEVLKAIHSFLAFQRQQHHASGTDLHH
jgi:hypothetical protein